MMQSRCWLWHSAASLRPAAMFLPVELIAIILEQLDITTIQRCRQVSRTIRDLIDTSVAIQYKIELAVAGMEDGPPSDLGPVDRLKILKEHQSSWYNLSWRNERAMTRFKYDGCECLGGVLAYVLDESYRTLVVRQLPSVLRGIEGTKWRINMDFTVHDFTFDPSQDLLAVMEMVGDPDLTVRIHACTLSTGKQHPLSVGPPTYLRPNPSRNIIRIYELQICGSLLGILHPDSGHLKIWNWKSGDVKMNLPSPTIKSFSFLSEQYLMLAFTRSSCESAMRLDIFDLGHAHDYDVLCSFRFPVSDLAWPYYTGMLIHCDVTSGRTSHSHGSVPFRTSQSDRLYIVTCTYSSRVSPLLVLFVHLSTLLAKIATLPPGTKGHQFPWAQWGENGARLLNLQPSLWWRSLVHGTKFALIRNQQLEVYDFNKLSVRRNRMRMRRDMEPSDTHLLCDEFIGIGPVCSHLPYDMRTVPISGPGSDRICSVLLTEDSLILITVADDTDCVLLTF